MLRAIESGAATQTLPARLQELENEQAVILGEISFLKGKRLAFTEDQILFALMKHLEPYPGESEQDYRRRIISDFVSEVYLYDDRLLIYFNISSEDGKLKSADLSNIEGGEFDEGLVSSTTTRPGIRNVFRAFVLVENSFLCDMELYRLMRLGFLQCIFCCFFSENQVYYEYKVWGRRKTDFSKGVRRNERYQKKANCAGRGGLQRNH